MIYKLSDLIGIDGVKKLIDNFRKISGLGVALRELDGTCINEYNWRGICRDFDHCNSPDTHRRRFCIESLCSQLREYKQHTIFECRHRIYHAITPIIVGGRHRGDLLTGQFFLEKPDPDFYRAKAVFFGFDEKRYLEAIRTIEVIPRERITVILDYLSELAAVLGELSRKQIKYKEALKELGQKDLRIGNHIKELEHFYRTIPLGLCLCDSSYRILRVNRAFTQTWGKEPEECLNERISRVMPGISEVVQSCIEKVFKFGCPLLGVEFQGGGKDKTGSDRVWLSSYYPVTMPNGIGGAGIIIHEITDRKKFERELVALNRHLKVEQEILHAKNSALKELIDHFEEDKKRIKQQIQSNIDRVAMPVLNNLQSRIDPVHRQLLNLLEESLLDIAAPSINNLERLYSKLSPREVEICNLIRNGLTSKEIGETLCISEKTVKQQRYNVRRKLEIRNKRVNLTSYLRSP